MPSLPPLFPHRAPALATATGDAAISVARMTLDVPRDGHAAIRMPPDDAHVLLFQLRDHPAHDIRLDGRLQRTQATFAGALHVLHLGSDPEAWVEAPADTLMFHLPRIAIDELTEGADAIWNGALRAPVDWRTPDATVAQLQPLLLQALAAPSPEQRMVHDHLMLGLGTHFLQAYGGLRRRRPHFRGGLAPRQERLAKDMLEAGIDTPTSIAGIARACGLSADHFSRAFRTSTGLTPTLWQQRRRVERAKQLLRANGLSLSAIATACGFSDQSHFSRVFSRHAGAPPGLWRQHAGAALADG